MNGDYGVVCGMCIIIHWCDSGSVSGFTLRFHSYKTQ